MVSGPANRITALRALMGGAIAVLLARDRRPIPPTVPPSAGAAGAGWPWLSRPLPPRYWRTVATAGFRPGTRAWGWSPGLVLDEAAPRWRMDGIRDRLVDASTDTP